MGSGVAWRGVPRSDRLLVERAQRGDQAALEALFHRHWVDAWRLAHSITRRRAMADDVAQDAFERAFAALSRFDANRPFAPWLHRIVVNRSLDLVRSERRLVGWDATTELEDRGHESEPGGDAALLRLIDQLSLNRVVVLLRYGVGYTPAQIAELLEVPVGTVHSRLARALGDLQRVWSGDARGA